ncbi:ErfK/YbiS/YcfS/YnhG family protein [Desulforamulus reducens MI-1]|uniref:ErfK/YbiS/YcfS/YnhG family protein n=1 Tax=Desulforamulus reducens (strain ATCC BAA-1160 / DSM 100696 / MI-1) TaxID=349161 RepID=A4J4L4_DESRM|nr:L,D-transpeptidase [Desulforamulus reducens]ABO50017.1 ErfK/YbiS/YcfS/YnhG family protein [Desulforamulus reducens MI-1]
MRNIKLILTFILLNIVIFISGCQNSPFKKPLQGNEIIYRDQQYTVYSEDNQIIVAKGLRKKVFTTADTSFLNADRIKNKPAEALPLKGTYLKDTLLIRGKMNSYLLNLQPNTKLLVSYPNPYDKKKMIIISKKNNLLYLYDQGYLVKIYPVATGKEKLFTPEGSFKIANKLPIKNADDPENLYGPRWMGLAVPDEKDKRANNDKRAPVGHKYGIHGTNEPNSIGTHASGGCIRLNNHDILELYDMVPINTKVIIK